MQQSIDCMARANSPGNRAGKRSMLGCIFLRINLFVNWPGRGPRLMFGTNARNRRGLSFMIWRRISSPAPALLSRGTKTLSVSNGQRDRADHIAYPQCGSRRCHGKRTASRLLWIGSLRCSPLQIAFAPARALAHHPRQIIAGNNDRRNGDEDRQSHTFRRYWRSAQRFLLFRNCLASRAWRYYSPHPFGPDRHDSSLVEAGASAPF
jgi:hypothetical protein